MRYPTDVKCSNEKTTNYTPLRHCIRSVDLENILTCITNWGGEPADVSAPQRLQNVDKDIQCGFFRLCTNLTFLYFFTLHFDLTKAQNIALTFYLFYEMLKNDGRIVYHDHCSEQTGDHHAQKLVNVISGSALVDRTRQRITGNIQDRGREKGFINALAKVMKRRGGWQPDNMRSRQTVEPLRTSTACWKL